MEDRERGGWGLDSWRAEGCGEISVRARFESLPFWQTVLHISGVPERESSGCQKWIRGAGAATLNFGAALHPRNTTQSMEELKSR